MTCEICPHYCKIPPGKTGKCNVISNVDGSLVNLYEGQVSQVAVEPIEKRPFYHVNPGSKFLSVGFLGCNFECKFCMNFKVSQSVDAPSKTISPVDLVELAIKKNVSGIAFTYNEPTIYFNYIEEVGHEIGRRNLPLKLVMKTSGFVRPAIMRNLCLYLDAVNIDIKGDDADYKDVCGGWAEPVYKSIDLVCQMGTHLEISYLVLPKRLRDDVFNAGLRTYLSNINPNTPLHLLYFYPFHKMNELSYKPSELLPLAKMFSEKMNYVYISNNFSPTLSKYKNTSCSCGSVLIDRQFHSPEILKYSCCQKIVSGIFTSSNKLV